jgi:hypothetical protein
MKRKNLLYISLMIIVLLLAVLACGTSNEGTLVTPQESESNSEAAETTNEDQGEAVSESDESESENAAADGGVFTVGDLVDVNDHMVRLNSVKYTDTNLLVANITFENKGDADLNLSSIMSFSAKKEDGTKLEQEIFDCGTGFDGKVVPGDRVKGEICWSGASPEDNVKIYYEPNLFGSGSVVWKAEEGEAEPLAPQADSSQIKTYQVGDLIEGNKHSIRLNSVEYQNSILRANFTVENHADTDVNMSSMLSFVAKKSDGTILEQEMFECGPSTLDGKVLPGGRLRGSICWSGANTEDEIKIYYEESLFGEGAIVWEAAEGQVEIGEVSKPELKVNVFKPGDLVEVRDHTIKLNETAFNGNVLQANFTIENTGSEEINVSSLLSIYAKKKDGSKLEQEFFNCGTSFDGTVLPGDKLTGDICWKGASPEDGIRIFYETDFFGEGAVVWDVE